jgi:hypothetical protein
MLRLSRTSDNLSLLEPQVPSRPVQEELDLYVLGSKSLWPDQLFKMTEIKQLCYFST